MKKKIKRRKTRMGEDKILKIKLPFLLDESNEWLRGWVMTLGSI